MQSLNFFQQVDSNGSILKSLTWANILVIVQKIVLLKLIFFFFVTDFLKSIYNWKAYFRKCNLQKNKKEKKLLPPI